MVPVQKSKFDSVILGLVIGLFVPFISVVIFYYTSFTKVPFKFFLEYSKQIDALPRLFSLGAIPNLGVFFLFLWRNHYYSARGVLMATIFLTFAMLIFKVIF
jgi:hypothetical protein